MKKMKKVVSLMLALVMALAMTVTAFAANTNAHTITITNEKAGHKYSAYQVLAGDISNGKLTNITWGSGVDGDAVLTALKAMDSYPYTNCNNAEDVADVLAKLENDSAALDSFAKVVGAHLGTVAGDSEETKGETSSTYKIDVTGDGYYFVKDTGTIAAGADDAYTKYILKVVGDVTVAAKAETPSIDKVIVNADSANGGDGKGTAQDVGSVVQFKLTSKVPKMDGYDTYTYIVHDTLSTGLTAVDKDSDNKIDVAVTIDGTEYTGFTVAQDGQSFTITFNNFINQKANAGKDIVITYSATLNENALTTDKETNKVYLKYSNNPYDKDATGQTPEKIVYVYDFDIVIDKYTGDETTGDRLSGAKFVAYKTVDNQKFYYFYNKTVKKVEWVPLADDAAVATAIKEGKITEVTTDTNGAATFKGLDSGTYHLHETAAPAGYNLLKGDVEVTITATYGDDGQITASSATKISGNGQYQQTQKVENKSGVQLPSTGGMGTTLFYLIGGICVVAAAVLLITRRRVNTGR